MKVTKLKDPCVCKIKATLFYKKKNKVALKEERYDEGNYLCAINTGIS